LGSMIESQGSLFTSDFLTETIQNDSEWDVIVQSDLEEFEQIIGKHFDSFPTDQTPNESQTENDLIWPVLEALGWTESLRQQNLSPKGREDIPDGLLFNDAKAKAKANSFPQEWRRYEFGRAVVESKRWARPLDRRSGRRGEETAPSTQMLRYMRRIDDITNGALRWGILTNGAKWRLYFAGARSVAEQFFEIDIAAILDLPGHNEDPCALKESERRHWLKVFYLIFRLEAFTPSGADPRSFHERVIEEGRFYEERVAEDLSRKIFEEVFPDLARAIVKAAPEADLQDVRETGLILLYRLLFILYAEDRDLLPVSDTRYDDYGLRNKVRLDVMTRKDRNDVFSGTAARYWAAITDLFMTIDQGDGSIGLPPYNGGLFDQERHALLAEVRIPDAVMAHVIDALSFEKTPEGRKYINYRNLSVQQLGSIYERLLEYGVTRVGDEIIIQPNVFARKESGSYYTPDGLVRLILTETLEPLIEERRCAFQNRIEELQRIAVPDHRKIGQLRRLDPATAILDLKICDPAMGSGHFLVSLVDFMADQVLTAMVEAEFDAPEKWGDYISPLSERIDTIRNTILANAEKRDWTINEEQLDDRHIIRRMVLKRCVYGVDKNPMAVELAKVALWLHTFTVGAPLSFLDHHLRCGDSLFGLWVRKGIDKVTGYGKPLLLHAPMKRTLRAASKMQVIEGLTDTEIAEAHRSADVFAEVEAMTAPLDALLKLFHAIEWLDITDDQEAALKIFLDGQFGDPLDIAMGRKEPETGREEGRCFAEILDRARAMIDEEKFLNWQVTFPGIWSDWEEDGLTGGFDAIIGNPPWDRMKLQEVEWFAARRRGISLAQRASDRKRMIRELADANDPIIRDYEKASGRAEMSLEQARKSGEYPLLSRGDVNIYSLFVERSISLISRRGMVGLLTPIGIGSDKTAARFFASVSEARRVKAFLAFENKDGWLFRDVHHEDQPTVFVVSGKERQYEAFKYGVKLHQLPHEDAPTVRMLKSADCRKLNPNTGTVPIFRDAEAGALLEKMYGQGAVLVDRTGDGEAKAWSVRYRRVFDMTNDSGLFRRREELEELEGAYPVGRGRFGSANGEWYPLYEGKMISVYNHRYAGVRVNQDSVSGQGVAVHSGNEQLGNPDFAPIPRYWVAENGLGVSSGYSLAFNDVCNTNNRRTLISAMVPRAGYGNTLPILQAEGDLRAEGLSLLLANFCSIACDFAARQKIQSRHLNKYILEQLPVIPPGRFETVCFGSKTAADIVRAGVLELTYTAHDMAPFARDMGYIDEAGNVKPPFTWDEGHRLVLRAKLDAVFFNLYGITDRAEIRYVYSTFPKVEREEKASHQGAFRSRELCLAYMNALAAGNPEAEIGL